MRYISSIASLGLALAIAAPALAQSAAIDPFTIATSEFAQKPAKKTKTRLHKANGGDKTVSIYKLDGGVSFESMGPANSPDWMVVNLGAAKSKPAQKRQRKLAQTFTKNYGAPSSVRGETQSWDVKAVSGNAGHAKITTVMLYVSPDGDQMLKLDRRKGGIGTPAAMRPVPHKRVASTEAPKASKTPKIATAPQTPLAIHSGEPD